MDWYSDPSASLSREWSQNNIKDIKRKLISANHILHHNGVVDAYGHISIRHPENAEVYIMCGYMAPGVVTTADDLIEYWIKDSSPVDPNAKKGYSERFIHGELFRAFRNVNCVVHSHAEEVLPYVTSGVPLLPVFHMAGFLGSDVPVFDIGTLYQPGEAQDLLVRNARLGTGLASTFARDPASASGGDGDGDGDEQRPAAGTPDHAVVLMRRHGYTTHGPDIETAVYRAIYTKVNASVQTNSTLLRQAFSQQSNAKPKFDFEPLTGDMCQGCDKMNTGTQDKPWRLWLAEVESSPLYVNRG